MATGDNFFDCDKKLQTEQVFRDMIYKDLNGKPALHTNQEGTSLDPWFSFEENRNMNLQQVFRDMILLDNDNKPYLNTTL